MTATEIQLRKYFRDRLDDISLLDAAVPITFYGQVVDLAVPAGGKRRGGRISGGTFSQARLIMAQLKGKSGFPNRRIVTKFDDGETSHHVEWGDIPPSREDYYGYAHVYDDGCYFVANGRYFGYSEVAIKEYIGWSNFLDEYVSEYGETDTPEKLSAAEAAWESLKLAA